jgi:hypothetical protein
MGVLAADLGDVSSTATSNFKAHHKGTAAVTIKLLSITA